MELNYLYFFKRRNAANLASFQVDHDANKQRTEAICKTPYANTVRCFRRRSGWYLLHRNDISIIHDAVRSEVIKCITVVCAPFTKEEIKCFLARVCSNCWFVDRNHRLASSTATDWSIPIDEHISLHHKQP